MGINSQQSNMSLKYFFFFVLFVVSAYATKCDITHTVEHDGDVTDSEVKESENGVEVSALAKNNADKQTFTGSGKCWNFYLKGGKKAHAKSSGSVKKESCFEWNVNKKQ